MKVQNLANRVKLSLQHHLELLFLTHQMVNWHGVFKTILFLNCISFSLQFTALWAEPGLWELSIAHTSLSLHYLALEEHLLSIHQHGVCATTIWAANCWWSQRGAAVLPSFPQQCHSHLACRGAAAAADHSSLTGMELLVALAQRKLCQCSSAALGNRMEVRDWAWLLLRAKAALWGVWKGSDAAFCLWLGHRKAATTKKVFSQSVGVGLVSQSLMLWAMLVCKPLMSLWMHFSWSWLWIHWQKKKGLYGVLLKGPEV